jgi:hypothetical protein
MLRILITNFGDFVGLRPTILLIKYLRHAQNPRRKQNTPIRTDKIKTRRTPVVLFYKREQKNKNK